MNKELIQLAIHMLDDSDGIPIETYDYLKSALRKDGADGKELTENVLIFKDKAFLGEDWVENNFEKFE